MVKKIQSAGGLVYCRDPKTQEPRFLLVKRQALSKKVEWVTPKGKIQTGEKPEQAALREIYEEVGLPIATLQVKQVLDTISLQLFNDSGKLGVDKDITYFLIQYTGDPKEVHVAHVEGFLWVYKRASIQTILSLVHYRDLRELFRRAFGMIGKISVRDQFIKNF